MNWCAIDPQYSVISLTDRFNPALVVAWLMVLVVLSHQKQHQI
jgi:hypothetical protein